MTKLLQRKAVLHQPKADGLQRLTPPLTLAPTLTLTLAPTLTLTLAPTLTLTLAPTLTLTLTQVLHQAEADGLQQRVRSVGERLMGVLHAAHERYDLMDGMMVGARPVR